MLEAKELDINGLTSEQWKVEHKKGNTYLSEKNNGQSDIDFIIQCLNEIDCHTNELNFDEEEVRELFKNKDWEGLYNITNQAEQNKEMLEVALNDYLGFIEAKEKNKYIY